MSKHTAGDWKHYQGKIQHKETRFIVSVAPNGKRTFVGKVYGHQGQPVLANAQLIITAPELLEACKLAVAVLRRDKQVCQSHHDPAKTIQAAIAAAEGKE